VVVEDLLEGDLAVQLGVERHEDRSQTASGVGAEDAEPLAVAGGGADGVGAGAVGAAVVGRARAHVMEGGVDRGVAQPRQALAGRTAGGERGQALLGVIAVELQVRRDQPLQEAAVGDVEGALFDQDVGQGPVLGEGPGPEGGDQLRLVDHPVLEREQPEQEVVRGVGAAGHGGDSGPGSGGGVRSQGQPAPPDGIAAGPPGMIIRRNPEGDP
jgi:hypothetical protein